MTDNYITGKKAGALAANVAHRDLSKLLFLFDLILAYLFLDFLKLEHGMAVGHLPDIFHEECFLVSPSLLGSLQQQIELLVDLLSENLQVALRYLYRLGQAGLLDIG